MPSLTACVTWADGRAVRVEGEAAVRVHPPPGGGPPSGESRLLRVEEIVAEGEAEVLDSVEVVMDRPSRQVVGVQVAVLRSAGQVVNGGVLATADLPLQLHYVGEDGVIRCQLATFQVKRLVPAGVVEQPRARVSVYLASV